MAQKVITQLVDDLDGKELKDGDGETVTFALDGTTYELDLSRKNADKFRGVFQDYIAAGRKVTGKPGKAKATRSSLDYNPKAVREWAKSKNIDVPERGRIPANVLELYKVR